MYSLLITLLLLLQATMDDPAALARATSLWGNIGHVGHDRGAFDTYWEKRVGYISTGCQQDFTVLGHAPNTWDDAFRTVTIMPAGPYSGIITVKAHAFDDTGVVAVQFRLDGIALGAEVIAPLTQTIFGMTQMQVFDAQLIWNSAQVTNGVHNLCATARDAAGNVGYSKPILFRTDQSVPSIAAEIKVP